MATYYWVGGSGDWNSSSKWSASSGGTGGAGVPAISDDVVFDVNSDTGTNFVVNIPFNYGAFCRNFTVSGLDRVMTIDMSNSSALVFTGDVLLPASGFQMTNISGGLIAFNPTTTATIDANGATLVGATAKNGTGTCTLLSNLNISGAFSFNDGTFDLGSSTLTCGGLLSTTSNTRTFAFGTGQVSVTGVGTSQILQLTGPNATVTGSANVYMTGTSGSYNIAVAAPVISFYMQSGTANITASVSASFKTLDFTGSSGLVSFNTLTITENAKFGSCTGTVSNGMGLTGTTPSGYNFSPGSVSFTGGIVVNGSYFLGADLLNPSRGALLIGPGSLDASNRNVWAAYVAVSGTSPTTLTMGTGTWSISGGVGGAAWQVDTSGVTLDASQATIKFIGGGTRNFYGGNKTYKTLQMAGTQTVVIYNSNTFETLTSDVAGPNTLTFESGTTNTFTQFLATGASTRTLTIRATTPGSAATLVRNNGNVNIDYTDIQDSTVSGTSVWYAGANSVNSGNNTGWVFGAGSSGSMLSLLSGLG